MPSIAAFPAPDEALLAHLGRQVLHPGGLALTSRLLEDLAVGPDDDVVELGAAPGPTTHLILTLEPRSYLGVAPNGQVASRLRDHLHGANHRVCRCIPLATGLHDASADVVIAESLLATVHPEQRRASLAELARITRRGGRIGLLEIAFTHDDLGPVREESSRRDLSDATRRPIEPLSPAAWTALLEEAGFAVQTQRTAPLDLLEPRRLLRDEGFLGATLFGLKLGVKREAQAQAFAMRDAVRRHHGDLCAFAVTAVRQVSQ